MAKLIYNITLPCSRTRFSAIGSMMCMTLLSAALLQSATGNMFDVIDAVDAFVAPPECPNGCMNWTAALDSSEQAANFADPSLLPALGARCAIPGNALHALTQPEVHREVLTEARQ